MSRGVFVDLLFASPPLVAGLGITWQLIWPRWKILGKIAAYLVVVAVLSHWIGHWSVLIGWLHQGLGIFLHIRFCRVHGFTWYRVEDPARYRVLSMQSVGIEPPPDAS